MGKDEQVERGLKKRSKDFSIWETMVDYAHATPWTVLVTLL